MTQDNAEQKQRVATISTLTKEKLRIRAVVDILKTEKHMLKPLIIYTASDLTQEQKQHLHLGLSAHLTRSRTTQQELVQTVRTFLNGLLPEKDRPD